jgi:hypothetical protein
VQFLDWVAISFLRRSLLHGTSQLLKKADMRVIQKRLEVLATLCDTWQLGSSPPQISDHQECPTVSGKAAPGRTTVFWWAFNSGTECTEGNQPRPTCNSPHAGSGAAYEGRQALPFDELQHETGLCYTTIHEELKMENICTLGVMQESWDMLVIDSDDPVRLVTRDGSWFHYHPPEWKWKSRQ